MCGTLTVKTVKKNSETNRTEENPLYIQENMAAVSGVRLNQQDPELPLAPDGGWGWVVCAGRDGHNHRLNMELDLQSPCHGMCTAVLIG